MAYKNSEGYADPTAGDAMAKVRQEEIAAGKCTTLVNTIQSVAHLAGFEVVGRIILKHKKTGLIFK